MSPACCFRRLGPRGGAESTTAVCRPEPRRMFQLQRLSGFWHCGDRGREVPGRRSLELCGARAARPAPGRPPPPRGRGPGPHLCRPKGSSVVKKAASQLAWSRRAATASLMPALVTNTSRRFAPRVLQGPFLCTYSYRRVQSALPMYIERKKSAKRCRAGQELFFVYSRIRLRAARRHAQPAPAGHATAGGRVSGPAPRWWRSRP